MISQRMVEALGAALAPLPEPAVAPARVGGDQVKLKEGLKTTILMLDFNPGEFRAWQNNFQIYYRTSRMHMAGAE